MTVPVNIEGPERWRGRGRRPTPIPAAYLELVVTLHHTGNMARFDRYPAGSAEYREVRRSLEIMRRAAEGRGWRLHVQNDPDAVRAGVTDPPQESAG